MIIDVHAHLGTDRVFDEVRDEEEILRAMEENDIDITIVQPMFGAIYPEDIRGTHDRIYRMTQKHPNKIFGMISMTPLLHEDDYVSEAKRCVHELGFVGLKLHPAVHGVSPTSKLGEFVWRTCSELKIPLMVHTGAGVPFSLPANVIPRCKQFVDVKTVLAHSGMISFAGEAFLAAQECPNVYLETSWTAPHHIEHFIHLYGANRVLFAGDEACNVPVEVAKCRSLKLSDEDLDWYTWKTAKEVFQLPL
jgi:uncharacterized protein